MAIPTKKFNGKIFEYGSLFFRDYEAANYAAQMRRKGYYARIVPGWDGNLRKGGNVDRFQYIVWIRKKGG